MNKTVQLQIQKSGLQTLIQDKGRYGHEAFGVPVGGAMDQQSYQLANWLVGNDLDSPVLEITLLGPTIQFYDSAQIAITGANLSPKLNNQSIELFQTINVSANDILSFGKIQSGCRAYLAIGGKWKIKKWLGSYSAFPFDRKEATPDSFIQKGNLITIKKHEFILSRKISKEDSPTLKSSVAIRVLAGPEFGFFTRKDIGEFFSKKYKITPNSNRMGYQLDAQFSDFQPNTEVISSGIIPGTIQITHAGQPIILMRDAQTTGGYFRIANVISADLDVLGQLKPGDNLRFQLVNLEEANFAKKEKSIFLKRLMSAY